MSADGRKRVLRVNGKLLQAGRGGLADALRAGRAPAAGRRKDGGGERVLAAGAKVCLVGNGPSLLERADGARIDGFDEVVRFNRYRTSGWAKHVGTKTTVWATTSGRAGPGDPEPWPGKVILAHGRAEEEAMVYRPGRVWRVPPRFYQKWRERLAERTSMANPEKILPSTGFLVLAWLLEEAGVGKVWVAGFDGFSKRATGQHHYWDGRSARRPAEHDGDQERAALLEWRSAGRVEFLSDGERTGGPGVAGLMRNGGAALASSARHGFRLVSDAQWRRNLAVCAKCDFWDPAGWGGTGKCTHPRCGCTKLKQRMEGQRCPLEPPKWEN